MSAPYTIYLVNQSASTQVFWCFLAPPQELVNSPEVFANSAACLAVVPNSSDNNTFTIPVQYSVGAGASNDAVGLGVVVTSSVTQPANLSNTWTAQYANVPPPQGPTLTLSTVTSAPTTIAIDTTPYDKTNNEDAQWFANQSFGIQTEQGFMGMTWSPSPNKTRTITPILNFYVSVGSFGENQLASWNDVSDSCASLNAIAGPNNPSSFQYNVATVTYTQEGEFVVSAGPPSAVQLSGNLAFINSDAHRELVALAYLAEGKVQSDKVKTVSWDYSQSGGEDFTYIVGTLTVTAALTATFSLFVLAGISFKIEHSSVGGTQVRFSYSGPKAANAIRQLFVAGANVAFGGRTA